MNPFLSAAHSIFSYIQGTAEAENGGFKWKTYDYENKQHYHFNVFNGVGGIPLFLGAYFQTTGSLKALELAHGALRWCIGAQPAVNHFQRGLQFGKTGIAYAALCLCEQTGNECFLGFCLQNAEIIARENPGPITDFVGGAASNGWYLLRLWKKTQEGAPLNGAIRCGEWISTHLKRDALGTHCVVDPVGYSFGQESYSGLSHGIAGIACFYAALFEATQDSRWGEIAHELFVTLHNHAKPDAGGLNWCPILGGEKLNRCQYSHGAPGIGLALIKGAQALRNETWLDAARLAGECTFNHGNYRSNPTLCTGLAGGGELLIELFKATQEPIWLERAEIFATRAMAYRTNVEGLDHWPTDTASCYSPDFTYGAAGIGYFFLRTVDPARFNAPLM